MWGGLTDEPGHDIAHPADYDHAVNSTPEVARLGTRSSLLARTQSEWVRTRLERPGLSITTITVESTGDVNRKDPLFAVTGATPGLFTKELEESLLAGNIDLAVHSLKDLPTRQPTGLVVRAVPPRESARDVLCLRADRMTDRVTGGLLPLAPGSTVGTSSLRREAQVLMTRPDLRIAPLRGNVPTRLQKAKDGLLDAVILAEAGLRRLIAVQPDLTRGVELVPLPEDVFVPAPAQGALAIETRHEVPPRLTEALEALHDASAAAEATLERAILRGAEGGCTLPLGVRCKHQSGQWHVDAFLGLLEEPAVADKPRRWMSFHAVRDFDTSSDAVSARVIERLRSLKELQPWTGAKP